MNYLDINHQRIPMPTKRTKEVVIRWLLFLSIGMVAVFHAAAQSDPEPFIDWPYDLDMLKALQIDPEEDWGIKADINKPGGYVRVTVQAFSDDLTTTASANTLLKIQCDATTTSFVHNPGYVESSPGETLSSDFELAMLDYNLANLDFNWEPVTPPVFWSTDEYKRALVRAWKVQKGSVGLLTVQESPMLRVLLILEVKDATLHGISIPGMDPIFYTTDHDVVIDVYSYLDRKLVNSYGRKDITSLNLQVGDSVVFKTYDPTFTVEGLKDIWLARSGGESKYYQVPERMGGFKPFLGFDHQVHGVALRAHPDRDHMQYPTIELDPVEDERYYYYWIAKGHVKSGLSTEAYEPTSAMNGNVALEKFKDAANFPGRDNFDIGGGETVVRQRNNQKEGLNMELMEKWDPANFDKRPWYQRYLDWKTYNYTADDYKIVSGLDGDEIVLLEENPNPLNPVSDRKLLQKLKEDWKELKEGETDDPVDVMVTYYQRNRMKDLETVNPEKYAAWNQRYGKKGPNLLTEIWDQNQYQYDPGVTSTAEYFNYKRPVLFNNKTTTPIPLEGEVNTYALARPNNQPYDEVALDLNVTLPGGSVKPFYNIDGESSPSMFEKEVPYTVDLTGLPAGFKNHLLMEYTFENSLGHLETDSRSFPTGMSGNLWIEKFDIKGSGYHEITLYYQHGSGGEKVILAGKELMEIQLRFLSVPGSGAKDFNQSGPTLPGKDLKEGRGEGDFWYLRDYRENFSNVISGVHQEEIGRTKVFPYVFAQGDEVTFNIMDADPQTFLHYTVDFYLSERFMSKRLDDSKLAADLEWYLSASPSEDGASIGKGRYLTHTFNNTGTYYLKVKYRNAHYVTAQVIVKSEDYQFDKTSDPANTAEHLLGKVSTRNLTRQEKDWLEEWAEAANGGTTPDLEPIRLAEVGEVFSMFTYNEGPRAPKGIAGMTPGTKNNRYGPQNDFNASYEWSKSGGFTRENKDILSLSTNDLTQLAEPYEDWFPKSWILHYMPGPDPKLISDIPGYHIETNESSINALVKGYFDTHTPVEPWQVRLPWVSQTQWKGFRTRTNIKALNKLSALFDNEDGAFSGEAWGLHDPGEYENYLNATNNVLPAFNDSEKDRYELYWGLLSGRLKLIHSDDLQTGVVTVKVKNPATPATPTTFISKYQTPGELPTDWMAGADMSSIPNLEAKGISWGYGQTSVDPYELVADYGMNTVRFRLWVDPVHTNGGGPDCSVPDDKINTPYAYSGLSVVQAQIQRAKAKGLKVLLDLHLSDSWTDPGANIIPEAWKVGGEVPDFNTLGASIYQYVTNTLQTLLDAGALPDYVQIGNETNSNILLSDAYEKLTVAQIATEIGVSEADMGGSKFTINWDRNAHLFNQGLGAVRSFAIENSVTIKTMVHVAGTYRAQDWIKNALFTNSNPPPGEASFSRRGIGNEVITVGFIDFLGMSYYLAEAEPNEREFDSPSVTPGVLSGIIADIKNKTGLPTVIVETAFPRTFDYSDCSINQMGFGYRGQAYEDVKEGRGFPQVTSDNLQKQWLLSVIDMLKNTDGGNGLLYWEPFWVGSNNETVPSKDIVGSSWENMSFFTFEHATPSEALNLLAAGGGIEAFCEGACPENLTGVVANKLAIIGNIGCSRGPNTVKVNSLIENVIKPGTIVNLGNSRFSRSGGCSGAENFYRSYADLYSDHLQNGSLFPVTGPLDYKKADGSSHNGLVGEDYWLSFFGKTDTYYSFANNDIEFFVINTNNRVGPGTDPANSPFMSTMKTWLESAVAASTKKYQIVLAHHSPYLSGHSSSVLQAWDFKAMGVDAYLSSGANFYERHEVDGIPFVNVGLGGLDIDKTDYSGSYPATMVPGTHYAGKHGALSILTGSNMVMFQFININKEKIDQFYLINREWVTPGRVDTYYLEKHRGDKVPDPDTPPLDVYLVLGQSNAEGRCASNYCYDEFTGDEASHLSDAFLLNEKGEFEFAKNAAARYSSVSKIQFAQNISFTWTFAQDMSAFDNHIGLIVNPIGGTDLAEWMPDYDHIGSNKIAAYGKFSIGYGGENLFHEVIRRAKAAKEKYPNITFKGVLWAQGENDAARVNSGELNYADKMKELMAAFRTHLSEPDLTFVLSEVSHRDTDCDFGEGNNWCHTELNNQIYSLHSESNVQVCGTADMETFDDINVHWKHDSYRTIGRRMACLMQGLPERCYETGAARVAVDENVLGEEDFQWNVEMYPNPTRTNLVHVELSVANAGQYDLRIMDMNGREMLASRLKLHGGVNHTLLSVESLASGTYVVNISGGEINYTEQLVITR